MVRIALEDMDRQLIVSARSLIANRQYEDRHAVSCAIRTSSGQVYLGLNLEAYVGRAAVCAESIAMGSAAIEGDLNIVTVVSIYKSGKIVSPCGICRELISDYSPNAMIVLVEGDEYFKCSISELLPEKYVRTKSKK